MKEIDCRGCPVPPLNMEASTASSSSPPPPPPPPRPLSIAVIGGGIAGVTLTIALLKRHMDVQLYERYSTFEEIGAGIGFRGNSVRAMSICDPELKAAFDRVKTDAGIAGQETVWFNWYDGYRRSEDEGEGEGGSRSSPEEDRERRYMFTLRGPPGGGGCHRAHFLEECIQLVPEGVTHFDKYLDTIEEGEEEEGLVLRFRDGSSATADAGELCPLFVEGIARALNGFGNLDIC